MNNWYDRYTTPKGGIFMKAIGSLFARLFEDRPTRNVYIEWDRQRNLAKSFGPSHVAEIDAIFSRSI